MKRKKIVQIIVFLFIAGPVFLTYMTLSNSTNCNQFVIDTYEIHSGINIPAVDFVNCYFDEKSNTRISIYDLKVGIDLEKFTSSRVDSSTQILKGLNLLTDLERPATTELFLATGKKWGTSWAYVVDQESGRLWAELNY